MIYHTRVFEKLSNEKKNRILTTAAAEFSVFGYQAANINIIADKCGVSVGALYKYFTTKENLFLTVCMDAVRQLSESLQAVEEGGGGIFEKVENVIRTILSHSRRYSELINLYIEITTEGNSELASKLSYQMESVSAEYYRRLISEAVESGELKPGGDAGMSAFCMDNLFMALQFSYASEYWKERMKIYVDENIFDDDERVVAGMMNFIKNALK